MTCEMARTTSSTRQTQNKLLPLRSESYSCLCAGDDCTPTRPCADLIVHIIEADLGRLRTREGMKVARAKGRLRGKQPKLKPTQEALLVGLWQAGEHTSAELADLFGVARSTVYRAIKRAESTGAAATQAKAPAT